MDYRPDYCDRAWRWYLAALGIVIGAMAALNTSIVPRQSSISLHTDPSVHNISPALTAFVAAITLAGVVGVGLVITFLSDRSRFRLAPRPQIQPQVLLIAFLVFLMANIILAGCFAVAIVAIGLDLDSDLGAALRLAGQAFALLGAFTMGMSVLRRLTWYTREDPREIGLRAVSVGRALGWGIGGYCAAIPFAYGSAVFLNWFFRILLKRPPIPEHPIVPEVLRGDLAFAIGTILAVVVAPIVEETFFRGMLYNALRGVMGVWGASMLSGAIFAVVHPTVPAGFIPLFALGVVFGILRESTGSLVPSMVCHSINNAVVLTLAQLIY
ncbi:MAG: CPBP family intramembrane metalloprotease [Armatimonadetes bacterium]|nr:CPBP family intramembrane metalloprotease [Armatimonadota bacterium]